MTRQRARGLVGGALALALLLSLGLVTAAGAAPAGRVVASGLVNPRYLTVLPDGTLYVSEAGTGGSENLPQPPNTPANTPPSTRGMTGQVTKVAPDGTKTVVAKGLPSYFTPGEGTVGPAGIAYANGILYLAIGGGAVAAGIAPLANENTVVRIAPQTGAVTKLADIGAYEKANNPRKTVPDSDLYGLTVGPDGTLVVANAGGDTVYRINPSSGAFGPPTFIPCIAPPPGAQRPPGGNPECRNNEPKIDSVPTSPAYGPDGTLYVGLLSGFPFPPGAAKVVKIGADGTVGDAVLGLTMVTDVAFGPDGNMYVCELTTQFSETGPPAPGRVLRVQPGGAIEVVADDLATPNGIAFDPAGDLFVTTNATGPTAGAPNGTVMRFDGVAATAAPPPAPSPSPSPAPMPGLPNTGAGGGAGGAWIVPLVGFAGLALATLGTGLAARRRRQSLGRRAP